MLALALAFTVLGAAAETQTGAIVFSRYDRQDEYSLERLDLATGTVTRLGPAPGVVHDISVSPDGTRIAYVTGPDRRHSIRLLADGDDFQIHRVEGREIVGLDWNPAGTRIAFGEGRAEVERTYELWSMSGRGNQLRRLTHNRAAEAVPSFTPNGKRIVLLRDFGRDNFELGSISARGGAFRRLTRTRLTIELDPDVGPDGRIAYTRAGLTSTTLVVLDGTATKTVSRGSDSAVPRATSWSPDGRTLAFIRNGGLFTVGVSTGKETRLLPGNANHPVFVP